MRTIHRAALAGLLMAAALFAQAQGNLEINTPAIAALKASMQSRHGQLVPFYQSGAIGLAANGTVAIRDAKAAPLAQRGQLSALVSAENADRGRLYREIAQANGHPEWADEVQNTFAQRWIDKAPGGWWVQRGGGWAQK
jgi:uncharacterized protein YdbL (DUF1318 family)